jgi:hypothetical protein
MSYIVITNLFTDTNVNIIFHISGQSYNLLTPRNVRWALILGRREYVHENSTIWRVWLDTGY